MDAFLSAGPPGPRGAHLAAAAAPKPMWIVEIPMTAGPCGGSPGGRQICAVEASSGPEALAEALRRVRSPGSAVRRRGITLDHRRATVSPWDWQTAAGW